MIDTRERVVERIMEAQTTTTTTVNFSFTRIKEAPFFRKKTQIFSLGRSKGGTSIDKKYVKLRLPKSKFGKKKPASGRETSLLPKGLGSVNTGPTFAKYCKRVQDKIFKRAKTKKDHQCKSQ